MPVLTKKFRDSNKLLDAVKNGIIKELAKLMPNSYLRFMGGDVVITALQPVGDKLEFKIKIQVTEDHRKNKPSMTTDMENQETSD